MLLAADFRRQARVCARMAEDVDDQRLAERLMTMASDLLAKADDFEELPSDQARGPGSRPTIEMLTAMKFLGLYFSGNYLHLEGLT